MSLVRVGCILVKAFCSAQGVCMVNVLNAGQFSSSTGELHSVILDSTSSTVGHR